MDEQPSTYAEVHLTRLFDAPRERVYRAFTEPDDLVRWIWGAEAKNTVATFEARVGAPYTIYTDNAWDEDGKRPRAGMRGLVLFAEPNEHLVYSLQWDADVGYNGGPDPVLDEIVSVRFADEDGGTRMEYHHLGVPDVGNSAALHSSSIDSTFDDLAKLLAHA